MDKANCVDPVRFMAGDFFRVGKPLILALDHYLSLARNY